MALRLPFSRFSATPTPNSNASDIHIVNSDSWKADFLKVSAGLRGLLIIWVTVGHLNSTYGDVVFDTYFTDASNTAAFVMLSGFSTCVQTRSNKLNYRSWIVSKWFGLIPISLLSMLMYVPGMQQDAGSHAVSLGTQLYMWVTPTGPRCKLNDGTGCFVDPRGIRVFLVGGVRNFLEGFVFHGLKGGDTG